VLETRDVIGGACVTEELWPRQRVSRASYVVSMLQPKVVPRWPSCARRPLARYATPVHGLYVCGAGTHPGGGVIAAAGHNAAHRALRDLRAGRYRQRLRHPAAAVCG
jgi:phytoene dehydrogenase-like protein